MKLLSTDKRPDDHLASFSEDEKRIIRNFAKLVFKVIKNEAIKDSISVHQDIRRGPE